MAMHLYCAISHELEAELLDHENFKPKQTVLTTIEMTKKSKIYSRLTAEKFDC